MVVEEGDEHGEGVHGVPGSVGDYVFAVGLLAEYVFFWDRWVLHVVVGGIEVFWFGIG